MAVSENTPRPSVCQKPDWKGKCCCSCRYHLHDMSHPHTDGERISHPRGWVCAPPEWPGVHSGWTEHGLCEMWSAKPAAEPEVTLPCVAQRPARGGGEEHY